MFFVSVEGRAVSLGGFQGGRQGECVRGRRTFLKWG